MVELPVTLVDRAGVNLADLSDEQRTAALRVLDALLSDEGYATVTGIMGGDEYLHEKSSSTEDSLGQYYIAFFGDPSDSSAWEIQFGGHHLGINATLDGSTDEITFAPTHLRIHIGPMIRVVPAHGACFHHAMTYSASDATRPPRTQSTTE